MTDERLPLAELLAKAGDGDFLRRVAEAVVQLLMETDVEGLIGAGRHERSGERTTYRNGYRDRTLDTRLGALQLRIPKLRGKRDQACHDGGREKLPEDGFQVRQAARQGMHRGDVAVSGGRDRGEAEV